MKRRRKIIIITSRFPFPLDKGDKLRIYHQIRYISIHNDIYLIALNTEKYISKECFNELKKYERGLSKSQGVRITWDPHVH